MPAAAPQPRVAAALAHDDLLARRYVVALAFFHLQAGEVDTLRTLTGRLLTQVPPFHGLLSELRHDDSPATASAAAANAGAGGVPVE